jgi:adenylate kinase family enzyme
MRIEKLIHQQVLEFRMIHVEACPGITAWNGVAVTRIHIMGGPGSGKTTLAARLSAYLHIPCFELDTIGWEGGFGAERSLETRIADIVRIAAQPKWVSEGSFLGWTDELLRNAEVIVWLDLPWRIAAWRIITRHARASLAGTNRHRGLIKLFRFLGSCREYYKCKADEHTREAAARYLTTYAGKLVHCRRPAEVKAFLTGILAQDETPEARSYTR